MPTIQLTPVEFELLQQILHNHNGRTPEDELPDAFYSLMGKVNLVDLALTWTSVGTSHPDNDGPDLVGLGEGK